MNEMRAVTGIIVDAGHGGADPGAVANGLQEKNLNLEAARYIYDRFRELGVPVTIIRATDETVDPTERVQRIMNAYGNDPNVILLSNHINAGGGEGAEVYYALRNDGTLARAVLNGIGEQGQPTRNIFQRRLPEDPSRDYYFIMRNTGQIQPLLIEYGYIDNANDARRLENNLTKYAEGVVKAVSNYAGIPYTPPEKEEESNASTYVVRPGDSLWSIADAYGTSVAELRRLNNLSSDVLQIGQRIKLPVASEIEPPISGDAIVYIVQPDDSLFRLSQKYSVPIEDIIQFNNLETTMLVPGQQLLIPSSETVENTDIYTVKAGDSLWKIANTYGLNVEDLIQANNLNGTMLEVGQRLVIPKKVSQDTATYTVQSGDSLWSIANNFGTTVNQLRELNNLTTDVLQVGQVLILPTNSTIPNTYTVQPGDSLWSIANRYNTTVAELRRINQLTSDLLQVGQILNLS